MNSDFRNLPGYNSWCSGPMNPSRTMNSGLSSNSSSILNSGLILNSGSTLNSDSFPLPNLQINYQNAINIQSHEHSQDSNTNPIWSICEEITSKKNWYSKVFDPEITNKWQQELPIDASSNFNYALKLLQATAQGTTHRDDCEWEDTNMCNNCRDDLKRAVIGNPEVYDLTPEDLED